MSHWKKFNSQVLSDVNKEILHKAMREIGVDFNEKIVSISNTWGKEKVSAGLVNIRNNKELSLGFNFKTVNNKLTLELTGDFFCTGLNEATFMNNLSQIYQKHRIIDICENQGYILDEDTLKIDNEGSISFDVYNYA